MFVIWLLMGVLLIAISVMFWMLMKKQEHVHNDALVIQKLENKVDALEQNLQKTLEIMQDLAKKMHVQQEVFDIHAQKLKQTELQQIEVVDLLKKVTDFKS